MLIYENRSALSIFAKAGVLTLVLAFCLSGCGEETTNDQNKVTGPEYVTAYEAIQYCEQKADKWVKGNWVVSVKEEDPDGINNEGKARIWEVFFFTPQFEENSMLMVIYNRGHVWPQAPTECRGGEDGRKIYKKEKPKNFRVDSPEAYMVALRNGGSDYRKSNPDAKVHTRLRSKADYDAVGAEMPGPRYQWIWDVYFRVPGSLEIFHVYVDGMSADYITKETKKPSS